MAYAAALARLANRDFLRLAFAECMTPSLAALSYADADALNAASVFSLLPPENATGNWVKITQRFPVRIKIVDWVGTNSKDKPLRVGSSATVTVVVKP